MIGDYSENHGIAGIFDNTYRQIDPTSISTAAIAAEGDPARPRQSGVRR